MCVLGVLGELGVLGVLDMLGSTAIQGAGGGHQGTLDFRSSTKSTRCCRSTTRVTGDVSDHRTR